MRYCGIFFFCHNVKKQCNNFNKKVTIINFSVTNFKTNVTYICKACDIYEGLRMKEPLFNIDKGAAGVWSFPVLNLFFVFYLFSFWLILQHRQGTEILCW